LVAAIELSVGYVSWRTEITTRGKHNCCASTESQGRRPFRHTVAGQTLAKDALMNEDTPDFSNVQSGASSTAMKTYEVVSGDSLSKIAKREYGNANEWKRIYEANQDILKNPDKIYPGQMLKIPPL
jgi:nucleoid-associated protein YgaU